MFMNANTKGLDKGVIRRLVAQDFEEGGPIIKRGVVYAELLMAASPNAHDAGGRTMLCGNTSEDFVNQALELMMRGKRRVYSLRGGLLVTLRHLVAAARDAEPGDPLLSNVKEMIVDNRGEVVPLALMGIFGESLWPIALGMLAGKNLRTIAQSLGIDLVEAMMRARRVRQIAWLAARSEHDQPVA